MRHTVLLATTLLASCQGLQPLVSQPSPIVRAPAAVSMVGVPAADIASKAKVSTTHGTITTISSPISVKPKGGSQAEEYSLRSFVSRDLNAAISHQLFVVFKYDGDWRFYSGAQVPGGMRLPFTEIDRSVIGCSAYGNGCRLWEQVGVEISEAELQEGRAKGMNIRITSRYSDVSSIFYLPSNLFEGQQLAIARYFERVNTVDEPVSEESLQEMIDQIEGRR